MVYEHNPFFFSHLYGSLLFFFFSPSLSLYSCSLLSSGSWPSLSLGESRPGFVIVCFSLVPGSGCPMQTCSQSGVADPRRHRLLVFGGTAVPFGIHNSNDLHGYDFVTGKWARITPTTDLQPAPRFGQSLVLMPDGSKLFLIGGTDGHTFFRDLWWFDLDTLQWQEISDREDNDPSSTPEARSVR